MIWGNIKNVPDREYERIRRVEIMHLSRTSVTHPPTGYRIDFIKKHDVKRGKLEIDSDRMERVNKELSSLKDKMEVRIIDKYRDSIIY
jgi:heat shock protein HtpX